MTTRAAPRDDAATPEGPWLLPDEPSSVRLMNTIWADRYAVHDALVNRGDLAAFLSATTLASPGVRVSTEELRRAVRLRDALRRAAAFVTADDRERAASSMTDTDEAIAAINEAAAVRSSQVLERHGRSLARRSVRHGSTVDEALATIATEAVELLGSDPSAPVTGPALAACGAPGCVLYFVRTDARREWCSLACGNRARAARHYRRHRHDPPRLEG